MTPRSGFALGLGGGLVVAACAWLTRPPAPAAGHTHADACLRGWGCGGCVQLFRHGVRAELRALAQAADKGISQVAPTTTHATPTAPEAP